MDTTPAQGRKLDLPRPDTFTLLLIYGFSACVMVSLSPALSAIRHDYGLSGVEVRTIMTYAMIAYTLGPLFSAPLSLYLGRRGAVLAGTVVCLAGYIFSGAASIFWGYEAFLAGRIISTFGSALAFCLAYAIINDYYEEEAARGVLAIIAAAYCVVPGIIMAVCGQITEYLGWKWITAFMLGYTGLTGWMSWRLPETCPPEGGGLQETREVVHEYKNVLSNRVFLYCAVITGLAIAALYVYATDAPLLCIDELGMSAGTYGFLSLIPYLGAIISLTLMNRFGKHLSCSLTTIISFMLIGTAGFLMLGLFMEDHIGAVSIFGTTFVLIAGTMPLNVTYVTVAESTTPFRGAVASLISAIFMMASILMVQISTWLHPVLGKLEYPATLIILLGLLVLTFTMMLRDPKGHAALTGKKQEDRHC